MFDDDWEDDDFDDWHEDDFDDDDFDDDPPALGSCCVCGVAGPAVRNILCLDKRAPTPGYGWSCVICSLPADGAIAVVCDTCLHGEIRWCCDGYPQEGRRVLVAELGPEVFGHDMSKHRD